MGNSDKEKAILDELKKYKTQSLRIHINVEEQGNGNIKIIVKTLDRDRTGNTKQDNHIIPVKLFTSSIKYNLSRQDKAEHVLSNLMYTYQNMDSEQSLFNKAQEE